MWWEHSEWAKKLAGGKVRGNLFYCYWFIGWDLPDLAKIVLLECNPSRNPSVLFTASSPLPNTEPAIQQMPNKCLWEWTIQRLFVWLICATPGAELYNSTLLSPSPEEEGKWVSKYPRKSQGKGEGHCKGGVLRHYPHELDLLCEKAALTINELESFCQCQLQEKTISKGHVDSWSVWAGETVVSGS